MRTYVRKQEGVSAVNTAHMTVDRYQTSCPQKIAKYLDITIEHKELPEIVKGIYVPWCPSSIIVVNQTLCEARQKFFLAYAIGVHIKEHSPLLCDHNSPDDVHILPLVFATELLRLNGEYGCKSIAQYYLENGSPPHMVIPLSNWLMSIHNAC
jgi:hypothetical protein